MEQETLLSARDLAIGYRKSGVEKIIGQNIDVNLQKGRLTGLIGPNGVGKSTLIRTLSGFQVPLAGKVRLMGESLRALTPKKRSKVLALVLPYIPTTGYLRVFELVALGRVPYTNWWGSLGRKDEAEVTRSLEMTGTTHLASRYLAELSDGEKQKVMIARALAQDTPLVVLDEPTAHLDVGNRLEIMSLLRKLAHEQQKAILLSTHDLEISMQLCDQIWLLKPSGQLMAGFPEALALSGEIGRVFNRKNFQFDQQTGTFRYFIQPKAKVKVTGEDVSSFWAKRALHRMGFELEDHTPAFVVKVVSPAEAPTCWEVSGAGGETQQFFSLAAFIQFFAKVAAH